MQQDVPTPFSGKVALVTGATSGIGRAAALAFARGGASVVLVGRNEARGQEVSQACQACGTKAAFVVADVSRPDDMRGAVAQAVDAFGRLDIAFNNAAYQEPRAPLADQPDDRFDLVFDTNVRSVFHAMKAEIAVMLSQGGGVIVNNASVSGVRNANVGIALYAASKAAVISLTRSAAMEYAPAKIRINAVSPGRILTPMMLASKIADMDAVAAGLPARRMGNAEEVAEAVLWLASDAAAFVLGHNLCVDGGFLAQ
jgi:NAD(P)-dependent dehydrogenase (short-subunit alcohol dehydrogenase family)